MTLKYVVIAENGEQIIILPPTLSHSSVVKPLTKVISAGQCYLGKDASCFGESLTLKVKSRKEEDTKLLQQLLKSQEW